MGHAPNPEPTFPAVHGLHLLELLARWRIAPEQLLAASGLTVAELSAPQGRMPLSQVEGLVERACRLTGEPGLGFYLGLQMRISAHGHLGFAAMTAGTLREALEVAARFAPTRTTALGLRLRVEGDEAALVVEERADLGRAREVILLWLMVGLTQIGKALTGQAQQGRMELAFPRPDYFERFAHLTLGRVRFGRPENRLCFPAAHLDAPLLLADPVALQLARAQCERDLEALGFDRPEPLRARLLQLLGADDAFPALEQVAARLGLSPRTLKRRLAAEGTRFSDVLDEARRQRAEVLLRKEGLPVEQVAERLGYSDAANFTRAFRRWTGTTPRAFRRGG